MRSKRGRALDLARLFLPHKVRQPPPHPLPVRLKFKGGNVRKEEGGGGERGDG